VSVKFWEKPTAACSKHRYEKIVLIRHKYWAKI
jgi:hypothetical protein